MQFQGNDSNEILSASRRMKYTKVAQALTNEQTLDTRAVKDSEDLENSSSKLPNIPTPFFETECLPPETEYAASNVNDESLPATVPRHLYCNSCERSVLTCVELQSTLGSFVLGVIIFLFFGYLSICILPLVWSLLQVAVHRCPLCNTVLLRRKRLSLFNYKEKVITFHIGTCALVLTRRYLIAILSGMALIFLTLGLRWYISAVDFPEVMKSNYTNATWTEFLSDCGVKSYLGNPLRAEKLFQEKYADKTVKWEGRLHHVQEGFFSKHFLYIDMDPPFYSRNDYQDIVLIFSKSLIKDVTEAETGDQIIFECTLLDLGRRGRPHKGILWSLNVTARRDTLPPLNKGPLNPILLIQEVFRHPIRVI